MTWLGGDVGIHSYGAGCTPGAYCGDPGMDAALATSAQAGVLHAVAAGNGGATNYPGQSRSVITVGALYTDEAVAYGSTSMGASSTGGVSIVTNGLTRTNAVAIVDITAPSLHDFYYTYNTPPATPTYGYQPDPDPSYTTSLSTPVVAAAAVLFRQASAYTGWNLRLTKVNMLLMGDSWVSGSGNRGITKFNPTSGAGRLRLHTPTSDGMAGAQWAWHSSRISLTNGQTWSKTVAIGGGAAMPAWVTQVKVAVTFDVANFSNADDVDIYLMDTCPAGGGAPVTVRFDNSFDVRSRISVRSTDSPLAGRCLRLDVKAFHAVSTAGVDVAYYYHGGDPNAH
jgi:hypothetical protein